MERDEIMEEQRYVFQINYSNGNPSDIIGLEGTNITSPDAFHKSLLNKSRGGTFDGEVRQLKILRDRWLNSKMRTVTSIPFIATTAAPAHTSSRSQPTTMGAKSS